MKKEMASKYDFTQVEKGRYNEWLEKGYFKSGDIHKKPYTIVIPPPNVTGVLHLGHAWDNTLQDMIIRFKRMQGFDALYLPGMDHAGIATQAKVEERLRGQNISKYDLGREAFIDQVWQWKEEYAAIIRKQWAKLGLSLDYSKERFTLDDGLSEAVRYVFVELYQKGLIYQGERIINWDPVLKTALSNIEVIHKEIEGAFYYFNYQVVDSDETLVIATTRPETMFGDVCVFVHPEDKRYQHLINKMVFNPANGEIIPILADDYIDLEFGTGVMKCTPAHDPNDFALSEKYDLERPICMHPDGTMNHLANQYEGMDRFLCREQLVNDLKAQGLVIKIEKHMHQVGHSERSNTIVEPYLSKQWFVKMAPLAKASLDNQENDDAIQFTPNRFEKTFKQWMENIEDWCISRQLWWGHQIPAWYHKETGEVYVGMNAPANLEQWEQDEDVLDTWFSSALWPFSTLGWPDENDEQFKRYYPTDVLATGYDIIFFWVSRMIFQGLEFTHKSPFKDVLIHGLIRAEDGRKMSKSLGNGIDPMAVIDEYGVDSLRYFLTTNSTPGMDLRYSKEKIEAAWNFINKIWNASRFVLMHIDEEITFKDIKLENLNLADRYILSRLNETIENVTMNMEKFEFVYVGNELYHFIWDDFCSWYIELSKASLNDPKLAKATKMTLVYTLNAILKMLHPFMPFVTEEIYQSLPYECDSIMIAPWPLVDSELNDSKAIKDVEYAIEIIKGIREVRTEYQIKNAQPVSYHLVTPIHFDLSIIDALKPLVQKMANAELIGYDQKPLEADKVSIVIKDGVILEVSLVGMVDFEAELERLLKEKDSIEKELQRSERMLTNEQFLVKASPTKIEEEKQKQSSHQSKYQLIIDKIEEIKAKC